jgi:hypothetical protein
MLHPPIGVAAAVSFLAQRFPVESVLFFRPGLREGPQRKVFRAAMFRQPSRALCLQRPVAESDHSSLDYRQPQRGFRERNGNEQCRATLQNHVGQIVAAAVIDAFARENHIESNHLQHRFCFGDGAYGISVPAIPFKSLQCGQSAGGRVTHDKNSNRGGGHSFPFWRGTGGPYWRQLA